MSDFRAVFRHRFRNRLCGTCSEPFAPLGPEIRTQELVQVCDDLGRDLGRSRDYVATMVVALGIEALLANPDAFRAPIPLKTN